MLKGNVCVLIALIFVPNYVLSSALRDSYVKAYDNTRRVSPSDVNFFFSGLYNKEGKEHDLGSDFGLTSDVYTKPNPYYVKETEKLNKKFRKLFKIPEKTKRENMQPEPAYYPVYNHSVTQDQPSAPSDESYDSSQSIYDSKSNNYAGTSFAVPSSYSVQSSPSISSSSYNVPSSSYSMPSSGYGSPSSSYGSPSTSYGSSGVSPYYPQPTYGPTYSSYGHSSYYPPPAPVMMPQPEQQQEHQKSQGEWLIAKLMKKFDLILVSKIMLKLIIFKKIVKFIAVICLLMFIPVLKKKFMDHSGEMDEEEERRIKELDAYANVDFRIKEIVNFAFTAIEGFSTDNIPWCVGESVFYCRFQYMLDSIDLRYTGFKIMNSWFPQLETTTAPAATTESGDILYIERNEDENVDEGAVDFNDFIAEPMDTKSTEKEEEESNANKLDKFNAIFRR